MAIIRMRESYKRFIKNVDLFRESMDSFCIVITNPDSKKVRFVPYKTNLDLFRIMDQEILNVFKRFVL